MAEKIHIGDGKKPDVFVLSDFNSNLVPSQITEKPGLEKEYIPSENRPVENSNTTFGSLAHLLKSSLGTGILAMPLAFKNGGLLFGAIGTIIVGIICTHCVHILVKTSQTLCVISQKPSLGYAETAEKVCEYGPPKLKRYANFAKKFVDNSLMSAYFGVSCVYIVFIATSVLNVVEYRFQLGWNIRIYIALVTIPILFMGQIRELKDLVPCSILANTFIVITFAITLYYMFTAKMDFSDKPLFSSIKQLPLAFSTMIFAMEGVGSVLPIENSMRKPQQFLGCPGVLNTSMTTVVTLYGLLGFFGYVCYGDRIQGSIILNLPESEILADVAKILIALAVFCTYSLQFYVTIEILWRKVNPMISKDKHNIAQYIIRTSLIIASSGLAAAVPKLEPIIGFVGAIFFSLAGLIIPTVLQSIFLWPAQLGKGNWILWKNIVFGLFGVFALISGSALSISDIIKIYS